MPPIQTTFELVPNGPAAMLSGGGNTNSNPPVSKPPMTSKQAKKLHKQATSGKRLTKIEERALLLEIKKEEEQAKAARKAKAARERKKEKEEAVKAEKKRRGEPIVNVRPSQGMISGFVRRAKQEKPATEDKAAGNFQDSGTGSAVAGSMEDLISGSEPSEIKVGEPQSDIAREEAKDPARPHIAPSETSTAVDVVGSSAPSFLPSIVTRPSENFAQQRSRSPELGIMRPPPARTPFQEMPVNAPQRSATSEGLDFKRDLIMKPGAMRPPPVPRCKLPSGPISDLGSPSKQGRPQTQRHASLGKPSSAIDKKPRAVKTEFALPSSTQMLFLDDMADLFPSSSQQALELIEDDSSLSRPPPSSSSVVAKAGSHPPTVVPSPPTPRVHGNDSFDELPFFSTQDFVLSSQEVRELEKPISTSRDQVGVSDKAPTRLSPICEEEGSGHEGTSSGPHSQQTPKSSQKRLRPCSSPSVSESPALPSQVGRDSQMAELGARTGQSPSSKSPPRKRFFTSSGSEAVYLAMEKSRQTYQREQRERELARQAGQARQRQRPAQRLQAHKYQQKGSHVASSAMSRATRPPLNETQQRNTVSPRSAKPIEPSAAESVPQAGAVSVQSNSASQETDYGDFDLEDCSALLDGITEEDLMIDDNDL
ncbi:uncharacterized protein E0L32_003382 [Thyridium curvatum]|uniref:Uncharacterized protein n=1 Tax=Thyridium curvatum TaxID=1093900 RepID=A0A507BJM3_9PEZI|nr:uncharacterized protein E0L32_003382 [Thyridium curvatum]TPX16820.1 hypothetical protein E0L32_003382 [Thyridium curvatum]